MAKEGLKKGIKELQNGVCALSDAPLPENTALFDTDRRTPKADGGIYDIENTRVVMPKAHMERHGTLRGRDELMELLKQTVDARHQFVKVRVKINNGLLAYKRGTDNLSLDAVKDYDTILHVVDEIETDWAKRLADVMSNVVEVNPIAKSASHVKSVGPVTIAYCLVYIDLEKANHPSSLWSYVGLHKPSYERYEKGVAGGGNKSLRTALYIMADCQMKQNGPYRVVYDNVKNRLSNSEKMVKTRNTEGRLTETAWKDTKPCHRHGAALRAIMKNFLADYWYVGRTLMGLPVTSSYAEDLLGKTHHTICPEIRGWVI